MDLATFQWILSERGQALLAEVMASDLSDKARLRTLERLRRHATAEQAAAAYELAWLRVRATAKFPNAAALYYTREALEQASGATIAQYRAQRYRACRRIADLCCGVGGDTLALAEVAEVTAVDRDPLRLAMVAANAEASGLRHRITPIEADLTQQEPPEADAIFFDPARRSSGRRLFSLADYEPPMSLVARWRTHTSAIGVKVAPGVQDDELAAHHVDEVEFISVDGELKEAMLWYGPLAQPGRRATLLSANRAPQTMFWPQGSAQPTPPQHEPSAYLYEPDPAVIRAHLIGTLAHELGAAQLDPQIAYLTADQAIATPFARCWRILEWMPFNLKHLRAKLAALDAGPVTVKKRGSPLDTDQLARQLSGKGARSLVIVLTRLADQPIGLICEGPIAL